jgi:hypothetical protein
VQHQEVSAVSPSRAWQAEVRWLAIEVHWATRGDH